jgi:hypothetical protein
MTSCVSPLPSAVFAFCICSPTKVHWATFSKCILKDITSIAVAIKENPSMLKVIIFLLVIINRVFTN